MQHGDTLTLKDGRELRFLTCDPDDGACLIGMRWDDEKDETVYETFECCQVVLVNGKPRTPLPHEVLNYLVPVLLNVEVNQVASPVGRERLEAILRARSRDDSSLGAAIHAAMRECP